MPVSRAIGQLALSLVLLAAAVMPPEASQSLIRAKAKAAMLRLKDFKPVPSTSYREGLTP